MFGWIFTAHQLGAAAAAFGGGLSRQLLDSYEPALTVAAVACLVAAMAAWSVRVKASRPEPALAAS